MPEPDASERERQTAQIRPRVGGQLRRRHNLAIQRRMLAECEKVLVGLCAKASNHEPVTIELVSRHLWMSPGGFSMSRRDSDSEKVPAALKDRFTDTPTYAARTYKVQLGPMTAFGALDRA